jgi:tubulin-specific chaperone E
VYVLQVIAAGCDSLRWLCYVGRRKDPKCASFVRPSRPSDSPRTFLEALKEKYASEDFEGFVYFNGDLKKKQDAIVISGKEVEEVGFDKIRQKLADFYQLRIVVLDGLCMTESVHHLTQWPWNPDDLDKRLHKIRETCPKIAELDLSRNLFEDWREVLAIVEQLPLLSSLKAE